MNNLIWLFCRCVFRLLMTLNKLASVFFSIFAVVLLFLAPFHPWFFFLVFFFSRKKECRCLKNSNFFLSHKLIKWLEIKQHSWPQQQQTQFANCQVFWYFYPKFCRSHWIIRPCEYLWLFIRWFKSERDEFSSNGNIQNGKLNNCNRSIVRKGKRAPKKWIDE